MISNTKVRWVPKFGIVHISTIHEDTNTYTEVQTDQGIKLNLYQQSFKIIHTQIHWLVRA